MATLKAVSVTSDAICGSQDRAAWAPCSRPAVPCPAAASISLSGFGFLPGARELFGLGKRRQRKRKPSTGKKAQSSATQPAASQPPAVKPGAVQGKCPLRGFAKPLGGLLAFSAKGQYKCPEAVIRMRAAVARLKPVRELRPQALPVKLLALGAFTGAVNLPSGIARVHVEKFSPGWFVAVHATIPFIAMLRKAVVMPKWAIAYTVGSAVLGQIMGARLERQRLQGDRPLVLSALPATGKRVNTAISAAASAQPRSCRLDLMSLVGTSAPAIAVL